ncbi:hypothetical protein DM01DRAFT_1331025 [Hesseltinella vesiculosa]|uniref:Actin-like ATPase domain-containing protein n=1 Tax=Hesseltinella vesiculosa TaxID=101127 RepID=A0A1X2GXV7_9FUNG|nr:hypothetical protein DM01DRAFT_1331025 [Hesseltinella vesiculosa]
MVRSSLDKYKVIIAYDFGTTYSGASYALVDVNQEVIDVQKWSSKSGNYYPKTPSILLVDNAEPHGMAGWGYEVKRMLKNPLYSKNYTLFSSFKLNLEQRLKRPELPFHLTPVSVVASYLRAMHQHVLQELKRDFTQFFGEDTYRYCLTVPAMWSDRAKALMREACIQAEIITRTDPPERLLLISEPEAAALYCDEICDQVQLQGAQRLMVCDAGGGTVDLMVFEVDGPRKLREVTKGMGGACGSQFLDERFRHFLNDKLALPIDQIPTMALLNMMDQFIDNIKPAFDGLDDHYLELPSGVPVQPLQAADPDSIDQGTLILQAAELKEKVFDPVINQVLQLIEQQFRELDGQTIDYLFLVGGFGTSHYLYQRIQDTFRNRIHQIVCPNRAEMAIVRGAVYFGLHPRTITARVSRRTYGINAGLPFDADLDPIETRVTRPDGSERCVTGFLPFVYKGDRIPIDHCIYDSMYIYYGTIKTTNVTLYATEREGIPRHYTDAGVHPIATIAVPIPTLPKATHGERIPFVIRMYLGQTEIRTEADFGHGQVFRLYGDFDAVNQYTS